MSKCRFSSGSLIQNIHSLSAAGYKMIPLQSKTKKPLTVDWMNSPHDPEELVNYVRSMNANVGLLNGPPSQHVVDIDIDATDALPVAALVLPPTSAVAGRASNERSHYFYRVAAGSQLSIIQHKANRKMIAEFRGGGCTAIPGSVHPSGEIYVGDISNPATVDLALLKERFGLLCATTLLTRVYPDEGCRHNFCLALSGFLAQSNFNRTSSFLLIKTLASLMKDDVGDRLECVKSTYDRADIGEPCASGLAEYLDLEDVKNLQRFLSLSTGRDKMSQHGTGLRSNGGGGRLTRDDVKKIIQEDQQWDNVISYNTRLGVMEFVNEPPVDIEKKCPIALTDDMVLLVCDWLTAKHGVHTSVHTATEALTIVAHANRYDPVVRYLEHCKDVWDGLSRLPSMLENYFNAQPSPLISAVGKKWMISAAARAFDPGCKADHLLVLEGEQGFRKSSAFKVLGGEYYAENPPSFTANNGKEFQEYCQGPWIIEFSELEAMRKSEATQIKAAISACEDRFRPSYGKSVQRFPRRCAFGATTNEGQYLRDPTGNRRYWPAYVQAPVNVEKLSQDRDQLWGEAAALYFQGEPWHLTYEESEWASEEQAKRVVTDPLEDLILEAADSCLGSKRYATMEEIIRHIELSQTSSRSTPNNFDQRVGRVLKAAGWKKHRPRVEGRPKWAFFAPSSEQE